MNLYLYLRLLTCLYWTFRLNQIVVTILLYEYPQKIKLIYKIISDTLAKVYKRWKSPVRANVFSSIKMHFVYHDSSIGCLYYDQIYNMTILWWYYYVNVSAEGTIVNITFSVSLCPVELLWSSISLWKINFILHSWQIHIAFRSSGCIGSIMNFRSSNIMINQSSSWFLFRQITSNLSMSLMHTSITPK